jgi:hypothetical protein
MEELTGKQLGKVEPDLASRDLNRQTLPNSDSDSPHFDLDRIITNSQALGHTESNRSIENAYFTGDEVDAGFSPDVALAVIS